MQAEAIRRAIMAERLFARRNAQRPGSLRPFLVLRHEHAQHPLELRGVLLRRNHESPRLFVKAGCRPARRLEKAAEFYSLHRLILERARAPSISNQIVEKGTFGYRLVHSLPMDARRAPPDAR